MSASRLRPIALSCNLERFDDAALVDLLSREAAEREAELCLERIGDIWSAAFVTRNATGAQVTLRSVTQPGRRQALLGLAEFIAEA